MDKFTSRFYSHVVGGGFFGARTSAATDCGDNDIKASDSVSNAPDQERIMNEMVHDTMQVGQDEMVGIPQMDSFNYHKPGKDGAAVGNTMKSGSTSHVTNTNRTLEEEVAVYSPYESSEQWKQVADRMGIKYGDELKELEESEEYIVLNTTVGARKQSKGFPPSEESHRQKPVYTPLGVPEPPPLRLPVPQSSSKGLRRRSTLFAMFAMKPNQNVQAMKSQILNIRRGSSILLASLTSKRNPLIGTSLVLFSALLIGWTIFLILAMVGITSTTELYFFTPSTVGCPEVDNGWSEWSACSSFCSAESHRFRIRDVEFSQLPMDREFCVTSEADACDNQCNVMGLLVQPADYDSGSADLQACQTIIREAVAQELMVGAFRVRLEPSRLITYNSIEYRYIELIISPGTPHTASDSIEGDLMATPQVCDTHDALNLQFTRPSSQLRASINPCITNTVEIQTHVFQYTSEIDWNDTRETTYDMQQQEICS